MNNQIASLASSAMVGMACSIFAIRTGMLPGEFGHPSKNRDAPAEIDRDARQMEAAPHSFSAPMNIRAVTHDSDVASFSGATLSSLNSTPPADLSAATSRTAVVSGAAASERKAGPDAQGVHNDESVPKQPQPSILVDEGWAEPSDSLAADERPRVVLDKRPPTPALHRVDNSLSGTGGLVVPALLAPNHQSLTPLKPAY